MHALKKSLSVFLAALLVFSFFVQPLAVFAGQDNDNGNSGGSDGQQGDGTGGGSGSGGGGGDGSRGDGRADRDSYGSDGKGQAGGFGNTSGASEAATTEAVYAQPLPEVTVKGHSVYQDPNISQELDPNVDLQQPAQAPYQEPNLAKFAADFPDFEYDQDTYAATPAVVAAAVPPAVAIAASRLTAASVAYPGFTPTGWANLSKSEQSKYSALADKYYGALGDYTDALRDAAGTKPGSAAPTTKLFSLSTTFQTAPLGVVVSRTAETLFGAGRAVALTAPVVLAQADTTNVSTGKDAVVISSTPQKVVIKSRLGTFVFNVERSGASPQVLAAAVGNVDAAAAYLPLKMIQSLEKQYNVSLSAAERETIAPAIAGLQQRTALLIADIAAGTGTDAAEQDLLNCPLPAELTARLKKGANGANVTSVQEYLAARYGVSKADVTSGFYGDKTKRLIGFLQKEKGLEVVGEVGGQTKQAILSDCASLQAALKQRVAERRAAKGTTIGTVQTQTSANTVAQTNSSTGQADDYGTGAGTDSNTSNNYCPSLSTTLQKGARDASTGGQVSELQKFLAGYFNIDQEELVSGYFGRITQDYVTTFQQQQGLPSAGIVGSLSREKIAQVCQSGNTATLPAPNVPLVQSSVSGNDAVPTGTLVASSACAASTVGGTCSVSVSWSVQNSFYKDGQPLATLNVIDTTTGNFPGGAPIAGTNFKQSRSNSDSQTFTLKKGTYNLMLYGYKNNADVLLQQKTVTVTDPADTAATVNTNINTNTNTQSVTTTIPPPATTPTPAVTAPQTTDTPAPAVTTSNAKPTGSFTATNCTTSAAGGTCAVAINWSVQNSTLGSTPFAVLNIINTATGTFYTGAPVAGVSYFQNNISGTATYTASLKKGVYTFALYGWDKAINDYAFISQKTVTVLDPAVTETPVTTTTTNTNTQTTATTQTTTTTNTPAPTPAPAPAPTTAAAPYGTLTTATTCTTTATGATCPLAVSWNVQNSTFNGSPFSVLNIIDNATGSFYTGAPVAGTSYQQNTTSPTASYTFNLKKGTYTLGLYGWADNEYKLIQSRTVTVTDPTQPASVWSAIKSIWR